MKNKITILSIYILSAMLFSGCTTQQKSEEVRQKETYESELVSETVSEAEVVLEKTPLKAEGTVNEVVIEAHIKEIKENTMIISSDSDEYPGAFFVDVQDTMEEVSDLEGGDVIIIHMMDKNSENQGMKEFLAYSILPREEQGEMPEKHDNLLTEAPILSLTDVLSSTTNELELQSGNYEWNYKNGEQMEGIVACGSGPMEEETVNVVKTLSIPDYNGLDKVVYSVNTVISPDKIVVTEWNVSDVGKEQVEPTRIVQYYCLPYLLELKSDTVYEIMAIWNENKLDINGFYGKASYYVVTDNQTPS